MSHNELELYMADIDTFFKDLVYSLRNIDHHSKDRLWYDICGMIDLHYTDTANEFLANFPPGSYYTSRDLLWTLRYDESDRLSDEQVFSMLVNAVLIFYVFAFV